jgi:hypothetical protein
MDRVGDFGVWRKRIGQEVNVLALADVGRTGVFESGDRTMRCGRDSEGTISSLCCFARLSRRRRVFAVWKRGHVVCYGLLRRVDDISMTGD